MPNISNAEYKRLSDDSLMLQEMRNTALLKDFATEFANSLATVLALQPKSQWPKMASDVFAYVSAKMPTLAELYLSRLPKEKTSDNG